MKQILIATTNPAKIVNAKKILAELGYEGLSFDDLGITLKEPEETGQTAEEIAAEKALDYAKQYKDLPILARDDVNNLIGIADEDDPKNHTKSFVAKKMGEYSDANGEKVFSEIANKYGGEVPLRFDWGYALAWHDGEEIKVVHTVVSTDPAKTKLVSKASPKKNPGFCFSAVTQVLVGDEWKYDSELTGEDCWSAYLELQAQGIEKLLKQLG